MIQKKISFLAISLYLSELSDTFQMVLSSEFERFGIELVNFFCEAIGPRPGEYEKLRSYKEDLALGSDFYRQRRSLDIWEKLAGNISAGSAGDIGESYCVNYETMRNEENTRSVTNQSVDSAIPVLTCPHCGAKVVSTMKFCGNCGKPLGSTKCPACGCESETGMKFCGHCGHKL
ncbi:zinc ribbon domain-containing protein [Acutalibacter caecimuris]|uniref:zinc ribbon domain-containing protein n=1 Tax=Acutalibacter caecimuris TaxID=3093657 RepID=UPI002AC983B6|nr:zinc-ribbon domain-containing protein [Acutalibacter sp. M00118]